MQVRLLPRFQNSQATRKASGWLLSKQIRFGLGAGFVGPAFLKKRIMKQRFPRKLKKIAKKRKSKADAIIMGMSVVSAAMSMSQVLMIQSKAIPKVENHAELINEKRIHTAQAIFDSAAAIKNILSEIKPWQYYTFKENWKYV